MDKDIVAVVEYTYTEMQYVSSDDKIHFSRILGYHCLFNLRKIIGVMRLHDVEIINKK